MPTLNRIRLVNIKYNDDKRIVRDDLLNIDGENTLALLKNAGGKSVLTKFLMQPIMWVYDKYPIKANPPYFDMRSYFRTNTEPCYVFLELKLESDGGYLLLVSGIAKGSDESSLKKVAFVYHYNSMGNEYSIQNFPLFYKYQDKIKLYGLDELYNKLKKESPINCFRNTSEHKRNFRELLLTYHINIKEWEKIHSRVVSMEGGLSEVFANSNTKTTKDLLNNWILESIEAKLDSDDTKSMIDSIHDNFIAYVQEKINAKLDLKLLTEYREFLVDLNELYDLVSKKESALTEKGEVVGNLVNMYFRFQQLRDEIESNIADSKDKIRISNENILLLSYQELSYNINQEMGKLNQLLLNRDEFDLDIESRTNESNRLENDINNMKARQLYDNIMECQSKIDEKRAELNPDKEKEYEERTRNIQYTLKIVCNQELDSLEEEIKVLRETLTNFNKGLEETKQTIKTNEKIIGDTDKDILLYHNKMYLFETERDSVFTLYPDISVKLNEADYYEDIVVDNYMKGLASELKIYEEKKKLLESNIANDEKAISDDTLILNSKKREIEVFSTNLEKEIKDYEEFILRRDTLINKMALYHFKANDLIDIVSLLNKLKSMAKEKDDDVFKLKQQQQEQLGKFNFYKNDKVEINAVIEKRIRHNSIDFYYGLEYLKKIDLPIEEKINLIKKVPILPYSLIVTSKDYLKLKGILQTEFTDNVVPILIREQIDRYELNRSNSMFEISNNLGLFGGYNEELIDENYIGRMVEEIDKKLRLIQDKINSRNDELDALRELIAEVASYPYTPSSEKKFLSRIKELEQKIEQYSSEAISIEKLIVDLEASVTLAKKELPLNEEHLVSVTAKMKLIKDVLDKKEAYFTDKQKYNEKQGLKETLLKSVVTGRETEKEFIKKISDTSNVILSKETLLDTVKVDDAIYLNYNCVGELVTNEDGIMYAKNSLKELLLSYQTKAEFAIISIMKRDIDYYTKQRAEHEEDLREIHADKSIYSKLKFRKETLKRLIAEKNEIQSKLERLKSERSIIDYQLTEVENSVKEKDRECLSIYGKQYDTSVGYKNFQQAKVIEYDNISRRTDDIKDMQEHISNLNDKINNLSIYQDDIIPQDTIIVQITIDNYKEVYTTYTRSFSSLTDTVKILEFSIKELLQNARIKYIQKLENEVIAKFINNFDNVDSERLSLTIKKFTDKIEYLKERESNLAKRFSTLSGAVQEYTSQVHQELQKIDKNSRIDPKGRKLFELSGVAKEGMKESLEEFLTEIVNDVVDGTKQMDYINKAITTYNLLDAFISLNKVQAYVIKFNLYDEVKVRFEDTYNGGQCSGAQRMIIAFVVLKSIMYYTSEGIIDNNKESTSFMFLDNPFGVLSTKELLEVFYKIAKKFNTILYSWTDAYKPEIIGQHNVIYYFRLVRVGNKEYVVITDKRDNEFYETINLDYIRQTSEQLTLELY